MSREDCNKCEDIIKQVSVNEDQEKRIDKLEEIVKDIPRMQARVHMLMYILIATMTILISISGFSFLQLLDFKKQYFADRADHAQLHSDQRLAQEQRYIDLIGKLGERVSKLESNHAPKYFLPDDE
jgi:hypothetical protein